MTIDVRICIACGHGPTSTGPGVEAPELLADRPLCKDALRCHSRELHEIQYGWRHMHRPHSSLRDRLREAGISPPAPRSRVAMAITVEASDKVPTDELHIVSNGVTHVVKL